MVISEVSGGAGSQMFCYATARRVANNLKLELKIDTGRYDNHLTSHYVLDQFNIKATLATSEEIELCKKNSLNDEGRLKVNIFADDCPDNIYIPGFYGFTNDRYFPGIRDILLKEFTLKKLSPRGEEWKNKILSAECAVAMHFRYGDFLYHRSFETSSTFYIPPIDYYCKCLEFLKQYHKNITVFVFSNNLYGIKKVLNLDVPTEFVEGWQEFDRFDAFSKRDVEEIYLMSLCKHNINSRSTFCWWGSYLNQDPDKKVFIPQPSTEEEVLNYQFPTTIVKNAPLESNNWLKVPCDKSYKPEIPMRPIFSLLLVVNNDAATIADTLDSFLSQTYKYYEVIIIDNASTDGSGKICRQKIADKKNVTFKRLFTKVNNAVAWNMAFKMAKGKYVSFLRSKDRFIQSALTGIYTSNYPNDSDIISSFARLEENKSGKISFGGKRFSEKHDEFFQPDGQQLVQGFKGREVATLLLNKSMNNFLSTKFFKREFLMKNKIKFDKYINDDQAEILFQIENFFHTDNFKCISNGFYVTPNILHDSGGGM